MINNNYYSTYQPQSQKEETSRNNATELGSKPSEYLDVRTDSSKDVPGESSLKWHLLLLIVFTLCSLIAALSVIVIASIRLSAFTSEYQHIENENIELREEIEDLKFTLNASSPETRQNQILNFCTI